MEKEVALREWCIDRALSFILARDNNTYSAEAIVKLAEEIETFVSRK